MSARSSSSSSSSSSSGGGGGGAWSFPASSADGGRRIEYLTLAEDKQQRRRRRRRRRNHYDDDDDEHDNREQDRRRDRRRRAQDGDNSVPPPPLQCEPCVCAAGASNSSSSLGPIKLRILTTQRVYAQLQTMLEEIAEDYERMLGPELAPRIVVVGVPTLEEMEREVKFDVRTRAGQFDGYIITPLWIGELAEGLSEITDFVREYTEEVDAGYWTDILLFYREVISSYDRKLYLFPFDGDVISMFYRRDLLDKYGKDVPKTWDEYNDLAAFFHGRVEPVYDHDPDTGDQVFSHNVTLYGSCVGRMPGCGNPYWAQAVLAAMTQVRGTPEGSLFDSADLEPLLGPAMDETLRLLGEQSLYGAPEEFDACIEVQTSRMNAGECALTYNWGNSFSDHVRPGSRVRGRLGVAPHPGSTLVLDRDTKELVPCTPSTCPYSEYDQRTGLYINRAPYGAYGGFSGAVSGNVSPAHRRAAARFFAFATSSRKAIRYVIPDAASPDSNPVVPTGMDPYARSMLVLEEWTSRGFDEQSAAEYTSAIESQLGSPNVVMDVRFPRAAEVMAALDDEVTEYCNDTKWGLLGENPERRREESSKRLERRWRDIIFDYDNSADGGNKKPGALLEIYQRTRGVYVERNNGGPGGGGRTLDIGAISGISLGVAAAVMILSFLGVWIVVRNERRKREEQWFIDPTDIVETDEVLGRGSFGIVIKGFLRGTPVALKIPIGYRHLSIASASASEDGGNGSDKGGGGGGGDEEEGGEEKREDEAGNGGDDDDYESLPTHGSSAAAVVAEARRNGIDSPSLASPPIASTPPIVRKKSDTFIDVNAALDMSVGASLLTESYAFRRSGSSAGASGRFNKLFCKGGEGRAWWCGGNQSESRDPLRAELLTLIKLRHDNIVQTLGATMLDPRRKELVLVLQYMQNNTVRSILKDPDGVAGTAGRALEIQWAYQVARGLGFLHSVPPPAGPMLHNDLKSSNVLVDGSYNAHISDFGLATRTMGGLWGALRTTVGWGGAPRGSLLWMAPEVLNGGDPTPASDVYSYSMFLVELMTRGRPFGLKAYEIGSRSGNGGQVTYLKLSDTSAGTAMFTGRVRSSVDTAYEANNCAHAKNEDELAAAAMNTDGDTLGGCDESTWKVGDDAATADTVEVALIKRKKEDDERTVMTTASSSTTAASTKKAVGNKFGNRKSDRDRDQRVSWSPDIDPIYNQSERTLPTSTTANSNVVVVGSGGRSGPAAVEFIAVVNGETLTRDQIVDRVKDMELDPPLRPTLPDDAPQVLRDICVECWNKNPKRRPTMKEVEERLLEAMSNENLTQRLMRRGSVFDSILPGDIQDKIARGETVPPKPYDDVTVIFSDIVGFTNLSAALTAEEVGDLIGRLLTKFDRLCKTHGVKKLDVIGDAFLGVVGVPEPASDHAGRAARFALGAIDAAGQTLVCPAKPDLGYVRVRFGLASGSVVATVIGSHAHPKYTLFGDVVNVASRMESSGLPNQCQCTPATAELLREQSPDIVVKSRGMIEIKGKGEMETFWISFA